MVDRAGQQLGNYQLVRLLGQGGFADVYLGEHIHLGSEAAIKVLHSQLTDDDVDKFRLEARNLVRLIHPHIVRVLDFGIQERTPFLVMDYAPNGTLRQRHARGEPLPLATVVSYVWQIADALQFAHDEKLIHRDIKPENMLLGRRNEILLSDFGIAIVAQSSRYQSTQDMAGTVAYMAPEQIQAHPRPASDQYSLGIVVYEWLTGERPFHGTFTEIAIKHSVTPPPPLREKVSSLPPDVEQVVLTALDKDPHNRFHTVQAFANALSNAVGQEQSLAPTVQVAPYDPLRQHIAEHMVLPPTVRAVPDEPSRQHITVPTRTQGILGKLARQQNVPNLAKKTKEQWLEEGNTHYSAGQFQEAIASFSKAIEHEPNYVDAYVNRGSTYVELKEHEKALADYDRAIALNPKYALAYNNRGNVYYDLQNFQEALADYTRAIELDPNMVLAYTNRGSVYSDVREYRMAIADFEKALELNPDDYTTQELYDQALRLLEGR